MSIAGHAGGTQVTMFVHQASGHTVVNHIVDTEDLFVLLSSFAPHTKASLNELSKIMGMPGKPEGIDGAEVEPYFLAGKIKEIADYCETDVVNTYRVWLKYELFRGRLSDPASSGNGCGSSPGRHTGEAGPLIWRNFLRPIPCDFASNPLTTAQAKLSSARERSSHWMIWAMSTYRLDKLFSPRSVAVVGASPRETSPGRAVLKNLRSAGFQGSISLVNPYYGEIEGVRAVKTVQDLREAPDLLVIAAPPQSVPGIVAAAGEKGAATAIIITAGLGHEQDSLAEIRPMCRLGTNYHDRYTAVGEHLDCFAAEYNR
jgi:predicted CoA-binding protein